MSKENHKKEKAITLIALVITIIILLILAGISIAMLSGENGILSKSATAGEETKKKNYEEILKIIGNGLRPDKVINNWSTKTYLDKFEEEISKNQEFDGSQVNRRNDETIIVITKEGYGYKITENEVKYVGKQGESENPKLEESNIIFTYNPSPANETWTNGNVAVSIKASSNVSEAYEIQYSRDGVSWNKYRKRNNYGRKWSNLCKITK